MANRGRQPHGCARRTVVLYRMRIDQAVTENLPVLHEFFRTYLLPVQFGLLSDGHVSEVTGCKARREAADVLSGLPPAARC